MKESNFTRAMNLSDGMFAYHLIGVMKACSESGSICPDPEAEALSYLEIFHAEALAREEAEENNKLHLTNPSD